LGVFTKGSTFTEQLGQLLLWPDFNFFTGLVVGIFISMEEKPTSFSEGFLVGYFLYVFQFFSIEFNCVNCPIQSGL
jgi:hypothetical protein